MTATENRLSLDWCIVAVLQLESIPELDRELGTSVGRAAGRSPPCSLL